MTSTLVSEQVQQERKDAGNDGHVFDHRDLALDQVMQVPVASKGHATLPSVAAHGRSNDEGTPLRERTTAALAYLVAAVTLGLLVATFCASNTGAFENKKNILLVGLPLVGTVLGYYFGRVPAEKRADQAQQVARASQEAHSEAAQHAGALSQLNQRYRDQIGAAANAIDQLTEVVPDPSAAIQVATKPAEDKANSLANAVAGLRVVRENVLNKSTAPIGSAEASANRSSQL